MHKCTSLSHNYPKKKKCTYCCYNVKIISFPYSSQEQKTIPYQCNIEIEKKQTKNKKKTIFSVLYFIKAKSPDTFHFIYKYKIYNILCSCSIKYNKVSNNKTTNNKIYLSLDTNDTREEKKRTAATFTIICSLILILH